MKFKVGDKVYIISKNDGFISKERNVGYGDSFKIEFIGEHDIFGYPLYGLKYCTVPFTEDELVLEEIWNSPLFQALKED